MAVQRFFLLALVLPLCNFTGASDRPHGSRGPRGGPGHHAQHRRAPANDERNTPPELPPIFDMAVNLKHNPWDFPCAGAAGLVERLVSEGLDLWGFRPEHLFEAIRGRTLWLLGDSQMEAFYTSVECFLSDFLEYPERALPTNVTAANQWLINHSDQYMKQGDLTWSAPKAPVCARLRHGTRVCMVRIHKVSELAHPVLRALRDSVPDLWRDIAVINGGLHYPIGDDEELKNDLTLLKGFLEYYREMLPHVIWKDTAPQHFEFDNGYYWWRDHSRGVTAAVNNKSDRCRALSAAELASEDIAAGGWYNRHTLPAIEAAGIPVWHTYNATLPLWEFHLWDHDCTHFCHPSAYELWTYLLWENLRANPPPPRGPPSKILE